MSQYSKFYLGTGAAPIEHIDADAGIVVVPDGTGGITIAGGNDITTTGTANTLTIDITGTTQYCVQVGDATGGIASLGAGLDHQFLRGNTGGNPSWNAVDLTTEVTGLLPVGSGGTGLGSITDHAVMVGSGTGNVTPVGPGTNGQVLIGSTGADPVWALPTNGTNITWTGGAGTLQADLTATIAVSLGGTGATTLTDHSVLVGSGTAAITPITVGGTGELLVGSAGADPAFGTSADGNFTFTSATAGTARSLTVSNTDNTAALSPAGFQAIVGGDTNTGDPYINFLVTGADTYSIGIDNSVAGNPLKITSGASPSAGTDLFTMTSTGVITLNNDLDVSEGGTGVSTLTLHGVLLGNAAGDIQATVEGATNQALLGNTGANPTWGTVPNAALTNSSITLSNGNNITVTGSPVSLGGTATIAVTGTTQYAVQVGDATGSLDSLAIGSAGQVLQSGGAGANPAWSTATYQATSTTGDVIYASAANTYSNLAFVATATRYLANTGGGATIPAWDQVNLTNGVTGTLPVGNGGLGIADPTDHAVLVGSGASAVTPITVGGTGELLVGSTGADPAFGTSANGNFTFTTATAGTDRTLAVTNTDSTGAAASHAHLHLQTNSASAGDPYVRFDISGGQDYSLGVDNSSTDALLITDDTNPSTGNTLWKITSAGERTIPLQPAFLAYLASDDLNVTGNGTEYTIGTNTALTEVFDQNGDFNTNGTFTAPVSGRYFFVGVARLYNLTAAATYGIIKIVTSNRTYNNVGECNIGGVRSSNNATSLLVTAFADMDAADTATLRVIVSGEGADSTDLDGDANPRTYFAGHLVC